MTDVGRDGGERGATTPVAGARAMPARWEAALLLAPGFAALPRDAVARLVPHLREAAYPAGHALATGDDADHPAYLILAGRVAVTTTDPVGGDDPALPVTLGAGDALGLEAELGLQAAPAVATALTPVVCLVVPAGALDRALAPHPAAYAALRAAVETALVARFLASTAAFASLDGRDRHALAARLEHLLVPPGGVIARRGESGDVGFLLWHGRAAVAEPPGGALAPGAIIGEVALLTGTPHPETVRAETPCAVLALRIPALVTLLTVAPPVVAALGGRLPFHVRPRRTSGIEAHERPDGDGAPIRTLKDPRHGTYYRLSPQGWFLWQRLAGEQTVRDLTLAYWQEFGAFAPQAVADLVDDLAAAGFVERPRLRPELRTTTPLSWQERAMGRARRLVEWYVPLHGVDAVLTRLYAGGVRFLFTRPAQLLLGLVLVAGWAAFLLAGGRAGAALAHSAAGGALLLALFPAVVLATACHEAGHAFATKFCGREVTSVGIGWYWFGPVAYVDTSDMWLADRRCRMLVNAAGMHINLVLAGLAGLAAWASPGPALTVVLWQFALVQYLAVLVNLNPLLELDGYFLLSDWLERPNLRPRALAWLGNELPTALRRAGLRALRGHALAVGYGLAALVYMAGEAWVSVALYRLMLRDQLVRFLPPGLTTGLTWVLAVAVLLLTLAALAADLRGDPASRARSRKSGDRQERYPAR